MAPLILLCLEAIAVSLVTGIGMCCDLPHKQFAVWHRNAAGYLLKVLVISIAFLISFLILRKSLVNADEEGKRLESWGDVNVLEVVTALMVIFALGGLKVHWRWSNK